MKNEYCAIWTMADDSSRFNKNLTQHKVHLWNHSVGRYMERMNIVYKSLFLSTKAKLLYVWFIFNFVDPISIRTLVFYEISKKNVKERNITPYIKQFIWQKSCFKIDYCVVKIKICWKYHLVFYADQVH